MIQIPVQNGKQDIGRVVVGNVKTGEKKMNIWTTIKTWFIGWFVGSKELKVIEVLEGLDTLFNKSLPIVKQIDEELKPALKNLASQNGDEVDLYETILSFLKKFEDVLDDVFAIAQQVYKLPIPDMLFTIAIEILKAQSAGNVSLSVLRLSVELAYNVYKKTK